MLINCKACGKEIAKGVKKCVNCGADQRGFIGRHKVLAGIVVFALLIAIGSALGGGETTTTSAPVNNPGISKAEFDSLKAGMTYDQVTAIIGGPGEVLSEVGSKGDPYHTIMYMWDGEKGLGANANVTFQGGKMEMKAQFGLE